MHADIENDPEHLRLLSNLCDAVAPIEQIHRDAVQSYTPVVENILRSGSRDVGQIEHTLDGLLDFCGHAPALLLYRRLCRHYFGIDPAATVDYVNAYREFYDEGATRFRAPADERQPVGKERT